MSFADAMREEGRFTRTENGAVALNTSGDARLDLFGTIGSLREADENRITTLFAEAYAQDKLFATKIAFYARDIRGGLGERKTFRTIIHYMAEKHPEALKPNLDLVGVFGRYDDLYELIGTPLEDDMWAAMKKQFEEDLQNLNAGNAISLLAKWIKTADASSPATRKLGILTAQKLGYPIYNFKRIVRSMRKQIGVVESLMSAGRWDEIKYPEVPSRAMMIYRKAFMKHDAERFGEFISKAEKGEVKINASTLFPYDIVEKILYGRESNKVLEAQWKALPDYVEKGTNALVMADVSGSMRGRPKITNIAVSIDTHTPHQIFHPCWWIDENGNNPAPYTPITLADLDSGKYRAVIYPRQSRDYVEHLEKDGKKTLCVWSYHCLQGTSGAAFENQFANMIYFHSVAKKAVTQRLVKGQDPLSEMYGIIKPEYDTKNYINIDFLNKLENYDKIIIAGEAKSHCVLESIKQILEHYANRPEITQKIYILEDCMSSISGFEDVTEQTFDDFKKTYHVNIVKSTDDIL